MRHPRRRRQLRRKDDLVTLLRYLAAMGRPTLPSTSATIRVRLEGIGIQNPGSWAVRDLLRAMELLPAQENPGGGERRRTYRRTRDLTMRGLPKVP